MRESWTDERLDYFRAETARCFVAVDKRFDKIEGEMKSGFADVERKMESGFERVDGRIDALQRTLLQIGGGVIATLIAGFFGIIATQL